MRYTAMSRRALLEVGACTLATSAALPALSSAEAGTGLNQRNEQIIRKYYALWSPQNEWHSMDMMLTDDFTFTSPVNDHTRKSDFKTGCWDTQHALVAAQDLDHVVVVGDQAFVRYTCRTNSGKSFRNVEYIQLKDRKIAAIECYFGGNGYPSAENAAKK